MSPPVEALPPFDPLESYYSQGIRARYQIPEAQGAFSSRSVKDVKLNYHPNLSDYLGRSAARVKTYGLQAKLPQDWPQRLSGPLVWGPGDIQDESDIVYLLSAVDKTEINSALQHFKGLHIPAQDVNRDTFPLPQLGEKLIGARDELYNGVGIAIIRGLDADIYDDVEIATIFLGISSYIAERRGKQDRRGSMMCECRTFCGIIVIANKLYVACHVVSQYQGEKNDDKGGYEMPFHTDVVCDTLALLTRSCSAKGGWGSFASAWTVYNELAATRPDLISVLAEPNWPLDTFGRDPPFRKQALLFKSGDKVILSVSRRLLTGSPETPRTQGLPALTEAQAEALDAVHFIGEANSVKISMKKGDMRFLNNMAILHSREAFEDDGAAQRHLLRLWLNNQEMMWKLPPALKLAWARVFDDTDRGPVWDFSPFRRNGHLFNPAESCD